MRIHDREDVLYLLRRTGRVLTPNQRLVVLEYAASEQRADGGVMVKATEMAELLGMTAPVFSRTRKELVALGWLREVGRVGQVRIYALDPRIEQERGRAGGHLRAVGG
ncbi:replication initiation protein, RepL2 [Streptomyces sp. c-19]|uniref:replication initiation protein, RepL2 n=1 Tax=Streptomyces sp. c-19 TaxID=2789275 RepID=UPI0039801E66